MGIQNTKTMPAFNPVSAAKFRVLPQQSEAFWMFTTVRYIQKAAAVPSSAGLSDWLWWDHVNRYRRESILWGPCGICHMTVEHHLLGAGSVVAKEERQGGVVGRVCAYRPCTHICLLVINDMVPVSATLLWILSEQYLICHKMWKLLTRGIHFSVAEHQKSQYKWWFSLILYDWQVRRCRHRCYLLSQIFYAVASSHDCY